jgi:FtsP/CotA-like multicopper oxidase with cupredoxin domain
MTSADRPMVTRRQVLTGLSAGGAILAVGGLASCTSNGSSRRAAPDGATGPTSEFAQPNELSSSAGRLAVTLVAAPATVPYGDGRRWALTYNGSTPGPTLRVRPGDELTITLDNRLDTPTNLHTHGLHVSPEGDSDNVFVMVDPGQQHTYRYQIPPDHPSGTFWYHPHHHGQVAPQPARSSSRTPSTSSQSWPQRRHGCWCSPTPTSATARGCWTCRWLSA